MQLQATEFLNKNKKKMQEIEEKLLEICFDIVEAFSDLKDLVEEESSLENIFEGVEYISRELRKKTKYMLEQIPRKALRELVPVTKEQLSKAAKNYLLLSQLTYLAYLTSGDENLLHLGALFYATSKALEEDGALPLLYIVTSFTLYSKNRITDALALAAYAAYTELPLRYDIPPEPWRDPEKWAALLQASYMYEVASKIDGELLARWGLLEALEG